MAEIMLDRPRIPAVVGKLIAGSVAQHVGVDRELDSGLSSGAANDLAHGIRGERRLALADKHVGRIWVVPLQPT